VHLSREGDEVRVRLEDAGPAFDPRSAPRADVSGDLSDRVPGGLGVHLMKNLCRRIDYERRDGHNVLTLTVAVVAREGEG
jgi:anti-sigma regulatory factor (Ser/Thr protein kinase)